MTRRKWVKCVSVDSNIKILLGCTVKSNQLPVFLYHCFNLHIVSLLLTITIFVFTLVCIYPQCLLSRLPVTTGLWWSLSLYVGPLESLLFEPLYLLLSPKLFFLLLHGLLHYGPFCLYNLFCLEGLLFLTEV